MELSRRIVDSCDRLTKKQTATSFAFQKETQQKSEFTDCFCHNYYLITTDTWSSMYMPMSSMKRLAIMETMPKPMLL